MATTAAAMVAEANGRVRAVTVDQLGNAVATGRCRLVDIREVEELDAQGMIPGAVHVPRGLLEFWADPESPLHRPELDPAHRTVLYCAAGARSALAATTLEELGYADVAHLAGGIAAWSQAGLPVVARRR